MIIYAALFMGSLAAFIAKQKRKDPFRWFFYGFLFGLLGVLYLCFFVKTEDEAVKQNTPPPQSSNPPLSEAKFWYYLDTQSEKQGPMSFEALLQAFQEQKISNESYVWNEKLEDWKFLKDFLERREEAPL
jgi:hypothetical protein